jgi:hypothetical protein
MGKGYECQVARPVRGTTQALHGPSAMRWQARRRTTKADLEGFGAEAEGLRGLPRLHQHPTRRRKEASSDAVTHLEATQSTSARA